MYKKIKKANNIIKPKIGENMYRKNLGKIILLVFLFIIYIYILVIYHIPDKITIFEGEDISLKTFFGITLHAEEDVLTVSADTGQKTINTVGNEKVSVKLFDKLFIKNVDVSVLPRTTVIPVGNIAGVKLYTNGVLVVGMSEIEGEDSKTYKPYENSGIEEGDTIVKVNNTMIYSTDDLIENVNLSNGENVKIEYIHEKETKECSIRPVKTNEEEYKLGLWVRDSAAGVGTVTFYEPETQQFGALGHGITDIDTGDLLNISSGEFVTAKVLNIKKGEDGNPGKIQGTVEEQETIGEITKNTEFGIYGKIEDASSLNIDMSKEMEVALRDEIQTGKATILCSLDNQTVKEYEIEITKIYRENNYNNKSMEIKLTDQALIEKTGGIIQGMSGSPIIQNGKFVGAVTHVFVDSATEGYAVFGDLMLKQSKKVN